ncbi:hypothetical protein WJR50_32860 [Catalinimonas sp. 4WD22]|uniref:hypothetical protein n=1 Tax=Catalinimonas locisalis TaxID=3133978 RepID=UPI0031010C1E
MESKDKILIYENEDEIRKINVSVRQAQRAYNAVYQAYQELDIPFEVKTVEDLLNLANDPEGVVRKSYLDKMPKTLDFAGVQVRQEAVSSFIEMPDLTELKKAAVQVVRSLRISGEKFTELELFQISGNEVIVDEQELEQEVNRFRSYAITEEEIARYKTLQKLCDSLNEAIDFFKLPPSAQVQEQVKVIVKRGVKYYPNHHYIKIKNS